MSKLVMLVGISGSGKSEYAKRLVHENPNMVHVSADSIAEQMYGENFNEKNTQQVFQKAHAQARKALLSGRDVVYDATNLSRKSRRMFLNDVNSISGVEKECHVILCPLGFAYANQMKRQRQVPIDVVQKHMGSFQMPEKSEGFSKIVYYNRYDFHASKDALVPRLDGMSQLGRWHVEDIGTHCRLVNQAVTELDGSPRVKEAAEYHDIGKYYTATEDERGMHFYNHGNVSTYLYLCDKVDGTDVTDEILNTARLIQSHDDVYRKGFSQEEFAEKYGFDMLDDLLVLRRADARGMITPERYQKMSLDTFLNVFKDWETRLAVAPFHINMKKSGDLVLFQYNQFDTDMNYQVSRGCRGSIYRVGQDGELSCVCRPFNKFFNYGEGNAAEIDWRTARVTEKVDGSLHKLWHDGEKWRLSTNGMIDAFQAPVGDPEVGMTFGYVFERALHGSVEALGSTLDKSKTYMFELTSAETQVVIPYNDGVYYLACRDTQTGEESFIKPTFRSDLSVQFPKLYNLRSVDDVLAVVQNMSKDEEGVVVNDASGNRVKVKSPEYLTAARMMMNGQVSEKRIYQYIRDEKIDDFVAYAPNQLERVNAVRNKIQAFCVAAEKAWSQCDADMYTDRKSFAASIADNPMRGYLFVRKDHPEATPLDYLFRQTDKAVMRVLRLEKLGENKAVNTEKKAARRLPDVPDFCHTDMDDSYSM